jgi:hypothetical protein
MFVKHRKDTILFLNNKVYWQKVAFFSAKENECRVQQQMQS